MNEVLAKIFRELATLVEIGGVKSRESHASLGSEIFRARAYEQVAYVLEGLGDDIINIYKKGGIAALQQIPGVGEGIAKKIEEYLKTGRIKEYDKWKKNFPVDLSGLMRIEGLGPKTIARLYKELGVKNVAGLEAAAKHDRLSRLKGWGEKSQARVLKSISFLEKSSGRFLLSSALPLARHILDRLRQVSGVKRAEVAGSLRRMQETVGDLDFLAISSDPEEAMRFFAAMPEVEAVIAKGETKTTVRLSVGMYADLRVVPPESFGAAWQYFVGDKYHNIAVRAIAVKKGYKLNEYGLFKGRKAVAGENEEEIYAKLSLQWIPPEMRTNEGEIELAMRRAIPKLIDYGEVRGDLQVQSDWTDGEYSIKAMAEAAKKEGLEYIAITDHTKTLGVAGGLSEEEILRQMKEIDEVQKAVAGIKILKGAEVNILKDGAVDISDEVLAKLDVVGASVHSHFNLDEKEMTARISRAMANPQVDMIFHPTGRLIQKREPYKVNMGKIIETARKTKTVLEINAYPERLDLKDEHIRQVVKAGVKMAIDSDAHSTSHFHFLEYGIAQARRGWATKQDVINTRGWEEMLGMLKK